MNKLIILLLSFSFFLGTANAQRGKDAAQKKLDKANLKYYKLIFEDSKIDFKATQAPAKWSGESKVMLAQKSHLSFFRNTKADNNSIKGVIRKRILLQDKNAVEDFSEFYFQESETVKINLIKKSGEEIPVDISNAIEVETEVPDYYSSNYQSSSYRKLAIPNLEVGDIIDYFVVFTENRNTTISFFSTLSESYPILAQEIIFDIDKLWSFYFNSFNDAPQFKQDPSGGIDIRGRKRKIVKRFRLVDNDRATRDPERWQFSYRTEPMFKVMAVSPSNLLFRSSKRDEIDSKINVLLTARNTFKQLPDFYLTQYVKEVKSRVKKASKTKVTKSKMVNNIYYFIRNIFLNTPLSQSSDWNQEMEMRSDFFAKVYAEVLKEYDIPSSIVVAVPPAYGTLKDVVSEKEIVYGVYVPTTKRSYWPVNSYNNHEDGYLPLNGAEAYQITYKSVTKKNADYKKVSIPSSEMENNISNTSMDINIAEQFDALNIARQSTFSGTFKSRYAAAFLTHELNYVSKDYEKMFPSKEKKGRNKKVRSKRKKEKKDATKDRAKTFKEKQLERVEDWFSSEFEIKDFKNFELVHTGRTIENKQLEVKAEYATEKLISKAGPNYIVEVGKLIGGQVALEEEEIKERKNNIRFGYARVLKAHIRLQIPEGYKAEGLDNLKYSVDHPNAAFVSTAEMEGNTLIIKTSKEYRQETIDKAEWPKIVEMLDAAYDFSQAKIVIKKK